MLNLDSKIFIRTLKRRYFNLAINLAGVSIGITCILLISVYLSHELNFDQHQSNKNRIYRMVLQLNTNSGSDLHTAENFIGLAHSLKNEFPEVEQAARIHRYNGEIKVKYKWGDRAYDATHIYRTEQEIFDIFDHEFLLGDPLTALAQPRSIVITKDLAKKYFGDVSPLNKALVLDNLVHRVTGVIANLPKQSDLYYEALTSFDFSEGFTFPNGNADWGNPSAYTYVLLKDKVNLDEFQSKLDRLAKEKTDAFMMSDYDLKSKVRIYPQKLSTLHFQRPVLSELPLGVSER
ncbi:MAG: ABC transporter permease, partial [Bacteroidota bacterium]